MCDEVSLDEELVEVLSDTRPTQEVLDEIERGDAVIMDGKWKSKEPPHGN